MKKVRQCQFSDLILSQTALHALADALIRTHGTYNVAFHNCQHFASDLEKAIIDTTIVEPDCNARYRFTRDHLKFMGAFAHSGSKPGWIMPSEDKILVNVMQTEDVDTWRGQVQRGGEEGKFFSRHCLHFKAPKIDCSQAPRWIAYSRAVDAG